MTMIQAMSEGLSLMADVLGARRKVDDKLVKGYLFVVAEDDLTPEDVESACRWFTRDGEGTFPAGPIFRRRCQVERERRISRQKAAVYESKRLAAESDPFSDEADEWVSREEAHRILQAAINKLASKPNPLTARPKSRRELDREIAEVRSA